MFTVYCEGLKTEPAYLASLRKRFAGALIEICTIGGVGVPASVALRAIKHVRDSRAYETRRLKGSFEERDQVWAVFDRDEHPKYYDSIKRCEANGVGVASSNPCFELWLLLHFEDYDKFSDRHEVQARLSSLEKSYDKSSSKWPDCSNFIANCEQASSRARKQYARRGNESSRKRQPPYTTMFMLIEEILKNVRAGQKQVASGI